jgi:ribosomal protein S18 acetylase RimI-like enzyme
LVLFEAEKPVALLVGRRETATQKLRFGYATIASLPVRRIVVVAGGFVGATTEDNWSRLVLALERLMPSQRIDLLHFEQLHFNGHEIQFLRRRFRIGRFALANAPANHWTMTMPQSWDEFLNARSKKHRYWLKRLPRVLERDFGSTWQIKRYESESHIDDFTKAADQVAGTSYQRGIGAGFRLNDEYVERVSLDARRKRLRGYVLFIAGIPVAYWYCSIYGTTLHLIATGFDPRYRDYELGTVLLLNIFREHSGTSIKMVDFGPGDADYKRRFASDSFPEAYVSVFANSPRGRFLFAVQAVNRFIEGSAKWLLGKARIAQSVKTFWRRELAAKSAPSGK